MHKTAIVAGAGIVGLAAARSLAARGYKVTVIERTGYAVGASVRNFGMVWPVGQPDGELFDRAMLSRSIWKEVCEAANIWYDEVGSLHLAYHADEWTVLQELTEKYKHRNYSLLSAEETAQLSPVVVKSGLIGAMHSPHEIIVDPTEAIRTIPGWLTEKFEVKFLWNKAVSAVKPPYVYMGNEKAMADLIVVCSGADFETLYPEVYKEQPLTKCKLQMMRMAAPAGGLRIGPALCGGLSLVHYNSFKAAPSLPTLRARYEAQLPDYLNWGIHVMVSQNKRCELTIGDSHEYGLTHDPFDRHLINRLILDYLKTFAVFEPGNIIETWNGIYPKLTDGGTELVLRPENGVTIINGLGGAGMTLSFGLCEQIINAIG